MAVKLKQHLDAPRLERTDRQSLLDYYDLFPRLPKYRNIEPRHFNTKPSAGPTEAGHEGLSLVFVHVWGREWRRKLCLPSNGDATAMRHNHMENLPILQSNTVIGAYMIGQPTVEQVPRIYYWATQEALLRTVSAEPRCRTRNLPRVDHQSDGPSSS